MELGIIYLHIQRECAILGESFDMFEGDKSKKTLQNCKVAISDLKSSLNHLNTKLERELMNNL